MRRYVDVSGYALTGKTAVSDLLREFPGYWVHRRSSSGFSRASIDETQLGTAYSENWDVAKSPTTEFSEPFEFNLIRIPGGIRDLETALVDDWSPMRSSAAVSRFKRLVHRIGRRASLSRPSSWATTLGWNYDDYFGQRFVSASEEYLARLIEASWTAESPFAALDIGEQNVLLRRIQSKLGVRTANHFELFLAAPRNFLEATQVYLDALLTVNVPSSFGTIVVHNAVEPFEPARGLRYFHDPRAIIVDRDPRDNYVASLWYKPLALPVAEFIRRYRLHREMSNRRDDGGGRVLRLRYEMLVLDYDSTVDRILGFLGESRDVHAHPRRFFDPSASAKNVGLWRHYSNQGEIEQIARELPEFCWN